MITSTTFCAFGLVKLIRAGEVAVGFGLRHQAVADKAKGLPVDFIDPVEGNFMLTEAATMWKTPECPARKYDRHRWAEQDPQCGWDEAACPQRAPEY